MMVVMCATFFLTTFMVLAAEDPKTPATLKGCKIISADEAKKLLDQKAGVFIDTRSALNFGKGHIAGALLIEYKGKSENKADFDDSKDQFDFSKLTNKDAKLVFYGHGTTGWKAYKGAYKAVKAGYKNVMWFRNGFEEWDKKGYPKE